MTQHYEVPCRQQNIKRTFDICISIIALVLLSPLFLCLALLVKASSSGGVLYVQERVGRGGKPFRLIKFRTMYVNSEGAIPQLTVPNDPRITRFGNTLRRYHLDELPQFYNVLRGDMSIIGYRPERQFFIDRIAEKHPEYFMLQKIPPGITSWGMVKYGYADSVEKMIERLKYDMHYLKNASLMFDLKILIHTVKIILKGRGI